MTFKINILVKPKQLFFTKLKILLIPVCNILMCILRWSYSREYCEDAS